ncbi:hypothetical protein HYPSUDRAFT_67170 [Hypholoma sublateritium FD-334 SS-4]|uniref:Uncharacterized protein n=1 Tax=Hypholoma sublateritium (strain FD-334 SS-4) TaxID=945553 RepID=A0A0D2L612_HYPSF|nr:hypothetical protein HYPSUDRAFT_67170 [Hypholoma sublateritium FD-334 SS-4]
MSPSSALVGPPPKICFSPYVGNALSLVNSGLASGKSRSSVVPSEFHGPHSHRTRRRSLEFLSSRGDAVRSRLCFTLGT